MITFALAVPHAPWIPGREESLGRLYSGLGLNPYQRVDTMGVSVMDNVCLSERLPNWEWSEQLWCWGARTTATHLVQLQDDVIPSPRFWPCLHAMVSARPHLPIGLHSVHPRAVQLAASGCRGYTTSDGLVGVGYVLPMPLVRVFLEWRTACLKPGAIEAITEDTLLCVWMMACNVTCWHPLPTIIDHDVDLASTYGNDAHSNRRAPVRWDTGGAQWVPEELEDTEWWRTGPGTPHMGRYYRATPKLCRTWVKDFTAERAQWAVTDVWRGVVNP